MTTRKRAGPPASSRGLWLHGFALQVGESRNVCELSAYLELLVVHGPAPKEVQVVPMESASTAKRAQVAPTESASAAKEHQNSMGRRRKMKKLEKGPPSDVQRLRRAHALLYFVRARFPSQDLYRHLPTPPNRHPAVAVPDQLPEETLIPEEEVEEC